MTPDEAKQLWTKVKDNGKALDACVGPHDFVDETPERTFGKDYRCSLCGGKADSQARHWYVRGLEHGRRPLIGAIEELLALDVKRGHAVVEAILERARAVLRAAKEPA